MPPRRIFFRITALLCFILAIIGGVMYPLNTLHIFWIFLYEAVVILGALGIIALLYRRGFEDSSSSS